MSKNLRKTNNPHFKNNNLSIRLESKTIYSPEVAAKYEELHSGAAERILTQFEKNSSTSREIAIKELELQEKELELQEKEVQSPFTQTKRKDWMGYSLLVALLGVSVVSGIYELDILSYSSLALFAGLILKAFFFKAKK